MFFKSVAEVVRLLPLQFEVYRLMKKSSRGGSYLKRLRDTFYHGQSYVHWTMTIENRKTGWLIPIFYYKFRELLTHTIFRYKICCPIFCLMQIICTYYGLEFHPTSINGLQ